MRTETGVETTSLAHGTRLGPYEILSALGAGGMGEVYRARDTRLDRTVAIKVLAPHLAADAQFRERFDREARAISSLSHPHICALYDVGHDAGTDFLVMEYLDGESLSARLENGAVPLAEALTTAIEIASALDTAHRAGIVHRDLKPGNVMLTKAGAKLLDFGLAKPAAPVVSTGSLSMSPTIPANLTVQGSILGTFQSMAPEQIEGQEADVRTDIFSFGVLAHEMFTGQKAFDGKTRAGLIGAIMHAEPPPISSVQAQSPPALDRLVRKCLAKDPNARWQTTRDLLDELRWIDRTPVAGSTGAAPPTKTATSWTRIAVVTAAALLACASGALVAWLARAPAPGETVAFTVDTPSVSEPSSFALSPDGRQLAFAAPDKDGQQKLWVRVFSVPTAHAIPGTERASFPFWSPDSRKIAFFTDSLLKQVDLTGRAPQTVSRTAATTALGGTWNDRDIILFARNGSGILRVAATGGEAERVTSLGEGENNHAWPTFLPDGRHFLYLKLAGSGSNTLIWRALDSSDERAVRKTSSNALYSPTGHLLFRFDGPIVAQRFDVSTGSVSGETIQIAGEAGKAGSSSALALSPAGVLAYRGGEKPDVAQLSWVDRQGKLLARVGAPGDYRNPVVDPAGERVVANTAGDEGDVWVLDVTRGTASRLTFDPANDSDPIFSPDGRWVLFYSARNPAGIYRKAANGSGGDELIAATGLTSYPRDWSSDGRFVLFGRGDDLWTLPMDGDKKALPYLATPASERDGHFSPDTHWVVYSSDETGRQEIFVQDFPSTGAKFQVSTSGGTEPRWRRDGRELFYLGADGQLMSVSVETKPKFTLALPTAVQETQLLNLPLGAQRRYSVSADGQRFLMNIPLGVGTLSPITVILNWQSSLKR